MHRLIYKRNTAPLLTKYRNNLKVWRLSLFQYDDYTMLCLLMAAKEPTSWIFLIKKSQCSSLASLGIKNLWAWLSFEFYEIDMQKANLQYRLVNLLISITKTSQNQLQMLLIYNIYQMSTVISSILKSWGMII